MNVQEAKELSITEGAVRTIHDKDGKLLWGRLAYDTKYTGDTFQQTYTGKNLLNMPNGSYTSDPGVVWIITNGMHVKGTGTASSNAGAYLFSARSESTFPKGENCTFSISKTLPNNLILRFYELSGGGPTSGIGQMTITTGNTSVTGTIPSNANYYRVLLAPTPNTTYDLEFDLQVETGTTPTAIEPYVGGTASPNPDYPQDIDVVTGNQTVQITAGTESEYFTANLGAIELCKISDYQDYIYKSGNDWYVHKEIIKEIFDGTENWNYGSISTFYRGSYTYSGWKPSQQNFFNSHFIAGNTGSTPNVCDIGSTQVFMSMDASLGVTTKAEWLAWLSNNNVTMYTILATPTDTQITDATLIGQLNAIQEWLTRYGYQASVTGNLPIIINQTALS